MADTPWKDRLLSPGQIAQRLMSIGCSRSYDSALPNLPNSQAWLTSTGRLFWISQDECDDGYLEGIVEQIEQWVKEDQNNKP